MGNAVERVKQVLQNNSTTIDRNERLRAKTSFLKIGLQKLSQAVDKVKRTYEFMSFLCANEIKALVFHHLIYRPYA